MLEFAVQPEWWTTQLFSHSAPLWHHQSFSLDIWALESESFLPCIAFAFTRSLCLSLRPCMVPSAQGSLPWSVCCVPRSLDRLIVPSTPTARQTRRQGPWDTSPFFFHLPASSDEVSPCSTEANPREAGIPATSLLAPAPAPAPARSDLERLPERAWLSACSSLGTHSLMGIRLPQMAQLSGPATTPAPPP